MKIQTQREQWPYRCADTEPQVPSPQGPHLIYCYPTPGPDPFLCEGWDMSTGRGYTFPSPIDVSGVG